MFGGHQEYVGPLGLGFGDAVRIGRSSKWEEWNGVCAVPKRLSCKGGGASSCWHSLLGLLAMLQSERWVGGPKREGKWKR